MSLSHKAKFKDILRQERLKRGWTQAEVAEKIGSDHVTVSRWETGKQIPTPALRVKLCKYFSLTPEAFGHFRNEQEIDQLYVCVAPQDSQFVPHLEAALHPHFMFWQAEEDQQQESPDETLRQVLQKVQALVLLASPYTHDNPDIRRELALAEEYSCPVLVLWIAGRRRKEVLPPEQTAVRAYDVIDARGQRFATAINELLQALKALPQSGSTAPAHKPDNPYKGLKAFQPEDAARFFGRERLIMELIDNVDEIVRRDKENERLLAVIGASGSGKSSVVLAGVLPLLQRGELPGSREWVYLPAIRPAMQPDPMRPGSHPLDTLADVLASHFSQKNRTTLLEDLQGERGDGLHLLAQQLVTRADIRVVLVIDQFEELFSQTIDEREREQFIKLLVYACTQLGGPLLVFLTMRADFYDRPMLYPQLGKLVARQKKVVYIMTPQELRAAIEKPAALPEVQVNFEQHLNEQLLADVLDQAGALPLLQFTLDALFERRSDHQLTRQAYTELGGVKGALSSQAEKTYLDLPSDEHRRMANLFFLHLIELGVSTHEFTSRREILDTFSFKDPELTRIMRETLDTFVQERLLTTNRLTATQTTTAEISHEALIQAWPRLKDWIEQAPDIRQQQRLTEDAAEWQRQGRPKKRLYSNLQLKQTTLWPPNSVVEEFLHASQQKQVRRRRFSIVSVLVLLILAFGTIGILYILPPSNSFTVTTLQDGNGVPGSLRDALNRIPPGGRISFAANVKGTILLTTNLLIAKNVTIVGPGEQVLAVSGGTGGYDLQIVDEAKVTISGLAFTNTRSEQNSLIFNDGTLTLNAIRVSNNSVTGFQFDNAFTHKPTKIAGLGGGIHNAGVLTLTNSLVMDNTANIGIGGGIFNAGTLMVTHSTISNNKATSDGGGIANTGTLLLNNSIVSNNTSLNGGGIANTGTLTLTHSTMSGNAATGNKGGGIYNIKGKCQVNNSWISYNKMTSMTNTFGGGIENEDSLDLTNSTVSNNAVTGPQISDGGGIANYGQLTLTNSTVFGNRTTGPQVGGGGILNQSTLDLTNSTVSNNIANGTQAAGGGGILTYGTFNVANSTISGNTAVSSQGLGVGGGIDNYEGILTLTNSTIFANTASGTKDKSDGGGLANKGSQLSITFCTIYGNKATLNDGSTATTYGGGIYMKNVGTSHVVMKNSLVAGNQSGSDPDIAGSIISGGYNLIENGSGIRFVAPLNLHSTDHTGYPLSNLDIDPLLKNNGGATQTLALITGSPAIGSIPTSACDISTDQRGVARPQNGACDIGAYQSTHAK